MSLARRPWPARTLLLVAFFLPVLLSDVLGAETGAAAKKAKKAKKSRKGRRLGDGGPSGLRCPICQASLYEALQEWARARDAKTQGASPYFTVGADNKGKAPSPEALVSSRVQKKVCAMPYLQKVPNPQGYALHYPTLQYECENFFDTTGEDLVNALTLGEDLKEFCWDLGACGDADTLLYELTPEDDDDEEL